MEHAPDYSRRHVSEAKDTFCASLNRQRDIGLDGLGEQ